MPGRFGTVSMLFLVQMHAYQKIHAGNFRIAVEAGISGLSENTHETHLSAFLSLENVAGSSHQSHWIVTDTRNEDFHDTFLMIHFLLYSCRSAGNRTRVTRTRSVRNATIPHSEFSSALLDPMVFPYLGILLVPLLVYFFLRESPQSFEIVILELGRPLEKRVTDILFRIFDHFRQ